jgi:glutamyl-tRNA reductase
MIDSSLFLVGATHRSAPFGFREKVALNAEAEAALAVTLKRVPGLREFVILNTCNRVELYASGSRHAVRETVAAFCADRQIVRADFEQFGFVQEGRDAVQHLCHVAAGLDSQILGETEIFGQTKRAYATAQARGSAGPILNRFFQKAFQAAKQVRSTTGITTGQVSVANVAVDIAANVFGPLADVRLLIIGAGEMAEKSAKAFRSRGAVSLCVTNRRRERADDLACELSAAVIPFEQRESAVADADIVVCSTAAPNTILSLAAVREAMANRPSRPLLLVDLAMPRDIDPAASRLDNVYLYNLDDLALVAARNREARLAEAEAGQRTLAPRIDSLWQQLQLQFATLPVERPRQPAFTPAALPA